MQTRPNILLILADDMGYSDLGCFGAEVQTPNLDRLAAGGVRFSSMYNCARCCPSRATLLTGLYPHQAGVGQMVKNWGIPSYQGYLRDNCATLGEVLGPAGYYTGYSGKWHTGGSWKRGPGDVQRWRFDDPTHPTPRMRGFERFYGNLAGGGSYFNPAGIVEQDALIDLPDDFYTTDYYTSKAIQMTDEAARAGRPFFVHLCYNAPHWPLHAHPGDIEAYRERYRVGWDVIRKQRHESLKGLGILDPRWAIAPRDEEITAWQAAPHPDWDAMRMAAYAGMIHCMDRNIGRVVEHLRAAGQLDNTVILFVSDNGGSAEFLREDGGRKETEVAVTRDGRPVRFGNVAGLEPGAPDTFMSYDRPWAHASNSPFRMFKHWVHEGGIATPMVAHWPGRIPAGGIVHSVSHFADIAPTLYEIAGAHYPLERAGAAVTPLEGESLLPALEGRPWNRTRSLAWEHEGNRALRANELKLVSRDGRPWELYNMERDRTELDDLAGRYPEKVRELASAYDDWAARCGVVDWDALRHTGRAVPLATVPVA